VSDLTVTYIVFPRSADKFQAPDYSRWQKRCAELLDGVGGLGEKYKLHTWKVTLPEIKSKEEPKEEESPDESKDREKGGVKKEDSKEDSVEKSEAKTESEKKNPVLPADSN